MLAALKSYEWMRRGRNVVLNIPTGTGKTMVANILSILMLRDRPTARCLYLAPSRSLAFQHRDYSRWLAPKYQTLLLLDAGASTALVQARALGSQIIISTPGLCASLMRSQVIPDEVVNSLCMISIDEFDDHFVFEWTDGGPSARLDVLFGKLHACLPPHVPVQLVSATDPIALQQGGNRDPEVAAFSSLMERVYRPAMIAVDQRLYARHIPTARIEPVKVNDRDVFHLGWAISVEMALTFDRIFEDTGLLLSRDDVLLRLEGILAGSVTRVRLVDGDMVPTSTIGHGHLGRLRDLLNHHEHLYEDMFAGFNYEFRTTKIFSVSEREYIYPVLPRLLDERPIPGEFHAQLRAKGEVLLDILGQQRGRAGVVFCRKIRLSDAIFSSVSSQGWNVVQVDSRFPDHDRNTRLNAFRDGGYTLLIITRRTGRRGLDLPQADFSVFYSPKARETTTWQELSRIRSNVQRTKASTFLAYGETADERRMVGLMIKMQAAGREYSLGDLRLWGPPPEEGDYQRFLGATGVSDQQI